MPNVIYIKLQIFHKEEFDLKNNCRKHVISGPVGLFYI